MVSPVQRIKFVRENLALAMALWKAAKNGHIDPSELTGHLTENLSDDVGLAPSPLNRTQEEALARSTGNQVRASFALAVTQTQQSLNEVFTDRPLDEAAPDLQAARCAIYLMNSALAEDMFSPMWDCPARFRRLFEVRPIRFVLDAKEIHGRGLNWDHFGGLDKFLCLLDYCETWAEKFGGVEPTSAPGITKVKNSLRRRSLFEEVAGKATDSVETFVNTRCELGERLRSTAKDLYASYVGWCNETGKQPVAQRSFGMRLTSLGLERRRRGRGKHWWEGIRLVDRPELAIAERLNGVH